MTRDPIMCAVHAAVEFDRLTDSIIELVRLYLDHHDLSKQDALLALAAVSAFVYQREPHHVQDDLDDFISPAIDALLKEKQP